MKQLLLISLLLLSSNIYSQFATISGHVNLPDSSSVSGATISIKSTTSGAVADNEGYYYINKVKPGTYTLRVSLLGYETQEKGITIQAGENTVDFVLWESNINLNEVVVTGTRSEKNAEKCSGNNTGYLWPPDARFRYHHCNRGIAEYGSRT